MLHCWRDVSIPTAVSEIVVQRGNAATVMLLGSRLVRHGTPLAAIFPLLAFSKDLVGHSLNELPVVNQFLHDRYAGFYIICTPSSP